MDEVPFAKIVLLASDGESAEPIPSFERRTRRRALAGALVLVLAGAVLVVLNRVAAQRIPGSAMTDWPQPPAAGSCVNLLNGVGGVAVVACSGPHDAEVTNAYSALDPVLAASPSASIGAACADAARAYLGAGADAAGVHAADGSDAAPDRVVALGLNFAASAAAAPASERVGDLGWMICDIQPAQAARYSGSVRGATFADAPGAYHWCWSEADRHSPVPCTGPHTAELFGSAPGYTRQATAELDVAAPPGLAGASIADAGGTATNGGSGTADGAGPADDGDGAGDGGARTAGAGNEAPAGTGKEQATGSDCAQVGRAPDQEQAVQRYGRALTDAIRPYSQARTEALDRECAVLVAGALGVADPTYGGLLKTAVVDPGGTLTVIEVAVSRGPDGGGAGIGVVGSGTTVTLGDRPGQTVTMTLTFGPAYCTVAAPDGRHLTQSLVGWGERPPPLTGG